MIPAFARSVDRRDNISIGMIRRQCTGDYKIEPIRRKVRELVQLTRKRSPNFAVVDALPRNPALKVSLPEVAALYPGNASR